MSKQQTAAKSVTAGLPPDYSGRRLRFFTFCGLFPVVKTAEVFSSFIDRLTNPQNGPILNPQDTGGSAPFFRTSPAGRPRRFFAAISSLSPSPTPSPPKLLTWLGKNNTCSRTRDSLQQAYSKPATSPSSQQSPRKDEQNHEHRHRARLLRHQNPVFFFPSRYLQIFP